LYVIGCKSVTLIRRAFAPARAVTVAGLEASARGPTRAKILFALCAAAVSIAQGGCRRAQDARAEADRGVVRVEDVVDAGTFGDYRALVIGINDYSAWPHLKFAERDAGDLRDLLVSEYGFPSGNVVTLLGAKATESNILGELHTMIASAQEKDNVLVYYAGHGQLDAITETGYWIPVDAKLADESSWIPFSVIRDLANGPRGRAKSVVLITDSCYGGALTTRGGPPPVGSEPADNGPYEEKLLKSVDKRTRQVIASGGFETVPDVSVFAKLWKDALRENRHRIIDLEYLFWTRVYPGVASTGMQSPVMVRLRDEPEYQGYFVLTRSGTASTREVPEVDHGPPSATADPALQVEIEFWNSVKESGDPDLFRAYLERYPHGEFAVIATKRLEALSSVAVPDVTGLAQDEAARRLRAGGFSALQVVKRASNERPGTVVRQIPAAGSRATPATSITIAVAVAQRDERALLDVKPTVLDLKTTTNSGEICPASVQGKIACDYTGSTKWDPRDVARLCRGAEGSLEPGRCFQQVMHGGVDWGGGKRWAWSDAVDLCAGTMDAKTTVVCFERSVRGGRTRPQAIAACRTNAPPRPPALRGSTCDTSVQGKIAWDYAGSKNWSPQNIARLCRGAEGSVEPGRCFQQVMHGGVDWGGGKRWQWPDAVDLCGGSIDAMATVTCYQGLVRKGRTGPDAIAACRAHPNG
jgi:hypothetical protein